MSNYENGASMANQNTTGNTNYQCLGDGQSVRDDSEQNIGSNNEQLGIGSNKEQPGIRTEMATGNGKGNMLDQCLGDSNNGHHGVSIGKQNSPDGQDPHRASGQKSKGGTFGCDSENDANMARKNATGISNYQCLGDGQTMMVDFGQNNGSNNEQPGFGFDNGNVNGATTSTPQHANARIPLITAPNGRDPGSNFTGKQSFASLFKDSRVPSVFETSVCMTTGNDSGNVNTQKLGSTTVDANGLDHPFKNKQSSANQFQNNRVPTEASKLSYIAPQLGKVVLDFEEIDPVESVFGFCLVGYVMGPRPSPYVLLNYTKGWGNDVRFTFKDNGWIRFQFPSEELRDRVLNGGPYMILGKQLFLKKLPSCFMFNKEDMEFFPAWVQIYGLPVDCWTTKALSKIASVVGKPLHTDLLTISKKGTTYARILVELDAKVPRVREYPVELPNGKVILIKFIYEFDPMFCEKCGCLGHSVETCGTEQARKRRKPRPLQREGKQVHTDGLENPECSKVNVDSRDEIPVEIETKKTSYPDMLKTHLESEKKGFDTQPKENVCNPLEYEVPTLLSDELLPMDKAPTELPVTHGTVEGEHSGAYVSEDAKSGEVDGMQSTHDELIDMDTDDLLDELSYVLSQGWRTVTGKKRNKKKNKNQTKEDGPKSGMNEDMRRFFENMEGTS